MAKAMSTNKKSPRKKICYLSIHFNMLFEIHSMASQVWGNWDLGIRSMACSISCMDGNSLENLIGIISENSSKNLPISGENSTISLTSSH